jgi:hypothetical protein
MPTYPLIIKASGEEVPYNPTNIVASLRRSGAPQPLADHVAQQVTKYVRAGMTTQEIYQYAFSLLKKSNHRSTSVLYGLRQAIIDLGPTGYPFERFIGELFKHRGYHVQIGQIVEGACVNHEVDVVAINEARGEHHFVECKFHNKRGYNTDVQVSLYIHSRFQDIMRKLRDKDDQHAHHDMWVVTNTKFSDDAATYGRCVGLKLLGWKYPADQGLEKWIEQSGLFPITCFDSIGPREKDILLKADIILCQDVMRMDIGELVSLGIDQSVAEAIKQDAQMICSVGVK